MVSDRCEESTTLLRFFWRGFREESEAVILHDFMSIFVVVVVVFVLSHRNFSMYVCENDDDEKRQNKTSGIYIISPRRERKRRSTHTL